MDDLKQLLDDITTLDAVKSGNRDPALFSAITRIGIGPYLIVPRLLRAYGLAQREAAEVWQATWSDPEALAAWAEYMEAVRVHYDIPLMPEKEPKRIVAKYDEPIVQSCRTPFQSLARRLLRR